MPEISQTSPTNQLHLRKVLTLWDLIFYGLVLIQPTAPIPLFVVVQKLSNGHTVTTILVAMFAMVVTAFSYGRMAAIYPSAGSAYTYVGRAINSHLGFMVGWAMLKGTMEALGAFAGHIRRPVSSNSTTCSF